MKTSSLWITRKKEQFFLALDIGTETVKALIYKRENEKVIISGASLGYFDEFSVFDSKDFEVDVIKKAIFKTIEEVQQQANKFPTFLPRVRDKRPEFVLIGLPANILKGRVTFQSFTRERPTEIINKKEEEKIFEDVFIKSKKEISQKFAEKSGILPEDLHFSSLKVLEIKIDGYQVSALQGYEGKNLDFRILAVFLPKYYLENFGKIIDNLNLRVLKIVHQAEKLIDIPDNKSLDAIFLDIGGEITQIFLIRAGKLELIDEFEIGGKNFSQALSQSLGLNRGSARVLKEEYSREFLSAETKKRIREIFSRSLEDWFLNLKSKLSEKKVLTPPTIFLFGGGSLLPEIQEILEEGDWKDLPLTIRPKVKFIYPKDLKNIEDATKSLNSPQYIPPLLISYAKKNF